MPFSRKKYVLKKHKKVVQFQHHREHIQKKTNLSCKNCQHRPPKSLTPSSSSSSNLSSTRLISKLPKTKEH